MVIEIIHCPVVLMVKMGMLTVNILCCRTLKNTTPWADVQEWDIISNITNHYTGRKHVVNFCFNHLSINLLWFTLMITSQNYNQSKFNLICAVFCSVLISTLEGPLFFLYWKHCNLHIGVEYSCYLVVWYQQLPKHCLSSVDGTYGSIIK